MQVFRCLNNPITLTTIMKVIIGDLFKMIDADFFFRLFPPLNITSIKISSSSSSSIRFKTIR
ncbi:hypothetical protein DERF_015969 [Dermatophagoides farinae]|uniref:Uncharacterized protein n=1 Tax=Dermatophagoides farinae TaxID=6954 RepID=A0A922HFV1_DERFA|nr:hypothetical protein DERF_015969 [Dermatophagoides farinae]